MVQIWCSEFEVKREGVPRERAGGRSRSGSDRGTPNWERLNLVPFKRIDRSESLANIGMDKSDAVERSQGELPGKGVQQDETVPQGSFVPRKPDYSFDGIILEPDTLSHIETLRSRIRNHDVLYNDWGLASIDPRGRNVAVSFYGPPGTGKTMCAEALAWSLGKCIIEVSYAELESKFVGETGKNIKLAFVTATESDAVLFFDEADSILGKRMTNVTQAADHGVNVARAVMLKELDAFQGVVVFATNLAKNFDGAFVRRILQHIEVPLPGAGARQRLWSLMLSDKVPGRDEVDFDILARESEGLSGGEIKNAVIVGLAEAVRRTGPQRRVTMEDLMSGIAGTQRAKHEIGDYEYAGDANEEATCS